MAGDWIKMRCNLWTHPKVVTLSLRLSVTRAHVIGALHGAWSVADQHGACVDMSAESLDSLVETPGLSSQLVSIGWLSTDDGKLQFLNYEEHNGATAKARALTNKRVAATRKRNGSVTHDRYKSVTREEKRRVEKNIGTNVPNPLPPTLETAEFRNALERWLTYKRERRESYTESGLAAVVSQAEKRAKVHGVQAVIDAIDTAMANGWQGWNQNGSFGARNGQSPQRVGPGQRCRGPETDC